MKWMEVKVVFRSNPRELAVELISNVFYTFGLKGVVEETPEFEADADMADDLPPLPEEDAIIGYFVKDGGEGIRCDGLEASLDQLKKDHDIQMRIDYREIDEQDWAENWKAFFWPEKIGSRIVVKPTWRDYAADPDDIIIEIDPGMAFGTGTHPTTAMCIRLIEIFLSKDDVLLDVGTGSGILLIAAAKLGAREVWGVDHDPMAVQIAKNNLLLNKIEKKRYHLICGHLLENIHRSFDLVVANLLTDPVLALLDHLRGVLKPKGLFIGSGINEENTDRVVEALTLKNFHIIEVVIQEKWSAVVAGREGPG